MSAIMIAACSVTVFAQQTPPRNYHLAGLPIHPQPKPRVPAHVFHNGTVHYSENGPNSHKYLKTNNGKHKGWYKHSKKKYK